LENTGSAVALAAKLTLLRASDGERILPAYFSDNYVSLLPGEKRVVEISYPDAHRRCDNSHPRLERVAGQSGSPSQMTVGDLS
jgi:hypothetical protein